MARAPLVLIVTEHEWASRSLGTVIAPRGYAVLRAYTGKQAMERAAGSAPDAVFISYSLPDMEGEDLSRAMLERGTISRSTPIILITPSPATREQRLRALEAGAWDVVHLPLDAEELVLRVERYIQGKLEADRLEGEALVDSNTGLYSWHGVSQRIREIGAAAERFGRPLACIVFAPEDDGDEPPSDAPANAAIARVVDVLRSSTRESDVLARIGPREFVVVAPDTSPQGAHVLAERLRSTLAPGEGDDAVRRLRAGIYAVADLRASKLDPLELVLRASMASKAPAGN